MVTDGRGGVGMRVVGPKGKTGNGWFVCFSFPIKITRQRRETNACFYFNVKKSTRSLHNLPYQPLTRQGNSDGSKRMSGK